MATTPYFAVKIQVRPIFLCLIKQTTVLRKKNLSVSCFSITYLHSGHHIYLDVAGKSFTDITFQADLLRPQLYTCPDRFGIAAQTSDVPYAVVS